MADWNAASAGLGGFAPDGVHLSSGSAINALAEVLPELIALDEWGYPIVGGPVPDDLRDLAVEAVAACPHAALRLLTARA